MAVNELTLDSGREQLHDFDVRRASELLAQAEDIVVQRGFAGAVVGAAEDRHERQS